LASLPLEVPDFDESDVDFESEPELLPPSEDDDEELLSDDEDDEPLSDEDEPLSDDEPLDAAEAALEPERLSVL